MTTLATVYLGWHYFLDDLAGIVIAVGALGARAAAHGHRPARAAGHAALGAARG